MNYPRMRKMTEWGPAHTVAHSFLSGKARWQVYVRATGRMRYEHTLVWEKYHGRPVRKGYVIHHKNGDPLDNRIENLEEMLLTEHNSLHKLGNMTSHFWLSGKEFKTCIGPCGQTRPAEMFPLNGYSAAGTRVRRPICRVCDRQRQKDSRKTRSTRSRSS